MVTLSGMTSDTDHDVLHRIEPDRNMARYYDLWLQQDLFGRTSLMCAWGRIGTVGRIRSISFPDTRDAVEAKVGLCRRKLARGYRYRD